MNTDISQAINIVEFANTGNDVGSNALSFYPRFQFDLGKVVSGASVSFNVNVRYGGADLLAPQDIVVNLAVDPTILTRYNLENASNYVTPPAAIIAYPTTLTIKKGTSLAQGVITVTNNASFDFNAVYGLPLKISSATLGTISKNFGSAIYSFAARNFWDGFYSLRTKHTGWAAFGILDGVPMDYPVGISLITATGTANDLFNEYTGTYLLAGFSGPPAAATQFGATTPRYTFNSSNQLTAVVNTTPNDGRNRTLRLDPAVTDSRYDPVTKKIYAAYIMGQTGRPDFIYRDTLTFRNDRP